MRGRKKVRHWEKGVGEREERWQRSWSYEIKTKTWKTYFYCFQNDKKSVFKLGKKKKTKSTLFHPNMFLFSRRILKP